MNSDPLSAGQVIAMLAVQLLLILINAFFAATELAVMQLSPSRLRRMAEEGDKAAPRMLRMVEKPSGFLSTIQIGITLAGFLASAFAADSFAPPLSRWFVGITGMGPDAFGTMNTVAIILIAIVLAYFTLVLGELVPKQIALHNPYKVARLSTGVISGMAVFMKPLVWLLSVSAKGVLRLFGIKGERSEEAVTEDEIRMMVDAGHEKGTIEAEEKAMIDNVFELDKTIARDVMTHRVDVVGIEADASDGEIFAIIAGSGLSRYPVYDDSLRELMRPARFVPETVRADVLLRDMQRTKDHLAIVLDEYGGFSGVVSMEDLIEEIVGSIYDEFDAPDDDAIQKLEENLWRIAGDADIEDIEEALGVKLPEEREYDSLGGLVFSQLSSIPADGEEVTVDAEGLHIQTEPVIDHHVEWARVSVNAPPPEENEEEDKRGNDD